MQTLDLRTLSQKVTTVQVTLFGAQTATVDMLSIIILMAVDSLQLLKDGKLLEQVMPTKAVKHSLQVTLSSVKEKQVQLVLLSLTDLISKID